MDAGERTLRDKGQCIRDRPIQRRFYARSRLLAPRRTRLFSSGCTGRGKPQTRYRYDGRSNLQAHNLRQAAKQKERPLYVLSDI